MKFKDGFEDGRQYVLKTYQTKKLDIKHFNFRPINTNDQNEAFTGLIQRVEILKMASKMAVS